MEIPCADADCGHLIELDEAPRGEWFVVGCGANGDDYVFFVFLEEVAT